MKITVKKLKKLIREAYVKRYQIDDLGGGGVTRQEVIDAPPRFERQFLQQVYEKMYNERLVELVNRMRQRAGMGLLSYEDRKELLDFINKLDEDTLYDLQSTAFEEARTEIERYVNDQMQVNPLTRSDYPGEGTKMIDATRRSQLFFTDNDFVAIYPDPDAIPFQDIQRVARLPSSELKGIAPGAVQYHGGQEGRDIDAYVNMIAAQSAKTDTTDPIQGDSVKKGKLNLPPKRPDSYVRSPEYITQTIETDKMSQQELDKMQIEDFGGEFLPTDIYDAGEVVPGESSRKATRDFMRNRK